MKSIKINVEATITDGVCKGFKGKVIGCDSENDKVIILLDEVTAAIVCSSSVSQ